MFHETQMKRNNIRAKLILNPKSMWGLDLKKIPLFRLLVWHLLYSSIDREKESTPYGAREVAKARAPVQPSEKLFFFLTKQNAPVIMAAQQKRKTK
jgi:hypothetical protein